jgi:hypothetical protein
MSSLALRSSVLARRWAGRVRSAEACPSLRPCDFWYSSMSAGAAPFSGQAQPVQQAMELGR